MENVLYEYGFDFKDFATNFIPLFVGLGFLGISIMLVLNTKKKFVPYKDKKLTESNYNFFRIIGFIVGPLGIGMALLCMGGMLSEHYALVERLNNEDVYVIEGYVENYHPMPREGHDHESFEINGVYFNYSDFLVMNGYNNTAVYGGVITHNGQYLKIKYITQTGMSEEDMNIILYIAEVEPPA